MRAVDARLLRTHAMPEGAGGPSYRNQLASAYKRVAELEAENRSLQAELGRRDGEVAVDHVRDLDATLQRWDRVRATLALVLGVTGLFALRIAERWSVRAALLASCTAMVVVGITLAWPKIVRAQVDPKPYALDVSRRWRRARKRRATIVEREARAARLEREASNVRVDAPHAAVRVSAAPDGVAADELPAADDA